MREHDDGLAAEPEWIKLQAPSFGVISQLDEDDTRRWAVEFDQFIGALHAFYDVEEIALPPLTIVLFKQAKGFAPYRVAPNPVKPASPDSSATRAIGASSA